MEKYIATIDQSTAGTKLLLFNEQTEIEYISTLKHERYFPQTGWVEQDPLEIFRNIVTLLSNENLQQKNIELLTITNQRETIVAWDKQTGQPIYNAIVWQCNRTTDYCTNMKSPLIEKTIYDKTGLSLNPYFSASKIKWLLDNVPAANKLIQSNSLAIGTIDSWLIWNLTNGKKHVTDITNASRTLLYNIHELKWDEDLLEIFQIPDSVLPKVLYSDDIFGHITNKSIPLKNIPISGVIGDSQAAFYAQECFAEGDIKATFGTGTSVMLNSGELLASNSSIANSIGWAKNNKVKYAQEGLINSSGDIINWLMNDAHFVDSIEELELMIGSANQSQEVFLIPSFNGFATPFWDYDKKAAYYGISRDTTKADLVLASVEAIAYQVKYVIDYILQHTEGKLNQLKVDGGATSNKMLMQLLANLINRDVHISTIEELSAKGSFMIGAEVCNIKAIKRMDQTHQIVSPQNHQQAITKYKKWKKQLESHFN